MSLLEKSRKNYKLSKDLMMKDKSYNIIGNRVYYSVYQKIKHLLIVKKNKGNDKKIHHNKVFVYLMHYLNQGGIPVKNLINITEFGTLKFNREKADYKPQNLNKSEVLDSMRIAQEIHEFLEDLI